jgi:hypothetical protein
VQTTATLAAADVVTAEAEGLFVQLPGRVPPPAR